MIQNALLQIYTTTFQKLRQGNNMRNISRLRVTSIHGYQRIDGFHINLLRAFDRGMIGVDADYRVVVSRYIHEDDKQAYGLKQLAGTRLYLPID